MTDQSLKQAILDELDWDPAVSAAHIGVTAREGIVTLTGHVSSYAERCAAVHAVGRVSGVRAIAEELEIRYLYVGHGDEDIAEQALNVLAWDLSVPKNKIEIKIDNGWVTLTGEVNWFYQRSAAESNISKLLGVMGVTNEIKIHPSVQATDVEKQIEAAFGRHAEFEAKNVVVTTDGGKITLTGHVDSYYERTLAQDTAWSAPGVTEVNDQITVD